MDAETSGPQHMHVIPAQAGIQVRLQAGNANYSPAAAFIK